MGERAFKAQMRTIRQRARKCGDFRGRNAEAIHARVNLEMKANRPAARATRAHGSAFEQPQLLRPHDRRREMVLEDELFFAGPEAGEYQHRLADATLPQLGAFGGTGHAKPVGARAGKRTRNGKDAVAGGIALDDRKNFPARAARASGVDVAADRAQVVRQCSKTYFRPDWASIEFYGSCHGNRHIESNRYRRKKRIASRAAARRLVTSPAFLTKTLGQFLLVLLHAPIEQARRGKVAQ